MKFIDAATALAFINNQRTHIEREVYKTIFPEITYQELVPVDTSAPEWTKTITVYSSDQWGDAEWINGNADDIPLAGNTYGKSESTIQMAGVGYGYGYEELHASMSQGVNLPSEDAIAARETYERFVDNIAYVGDKSKGMQGLINADGVTIESATNKFMTSTEDAILKDVNKLLGGTATGTSYQMPANVLLLPYSTFTYLASTPLSNKEGTLLDFIKKYNVYTAITGQPLIIRAFHKLTKAAAGGTNDRMVAYARNPRVLKLNIPMPHKFLPTYQTGALNWVVPGIFRLGGLEIRNKDAIRYMDGV